MSFDYDLFVIGAGAGGLAASELPVRFPGSSVSRFLKSGCLWCACGDRRRRFSRGNLCNARLHSRKTNVLCSNTLSVDTVLYVAGRAPNVSGLALVKAGVKVTQGGISVDMYSRTTQPNIFAIGDCTNGLNLTPVVIAQARAFADSEFGNNPQAVSYEYVPIIVISHPEAATVGLSEA